MRIHFIAIGGSAMHNLALALHDQGHTVTGSDDEIYEPSKSRLDKAGILPSAFGWYPEKIDESIDAIILGMHARPNNPELLVAQQQGRQIYSYPEFVAKQSMNKKRIVVAGSHGKTTTTSIVMHALGKAEVNYDYLVGAQLKGFDRMVHLSDNELIILEGDEYLSSPIDRRPKMMHYDPDVAIITGIAWDHINVFPTIEDYVDQFRQFVTAMKSSSILYYYEHDQYMQAIISEGKHSCSTQAYDQILLDGNQKYVVGDDSYAIHLIGNHNLQNILAAELVCDHLGVGAHTFYESLSDFSGASRRLQVLKEGGARSGFVYLDFAHAPSKVKATTDAVKDWYPKPELIAIFELHTFSSLNAAFLPQYKHALESADRAIVFYSDHALKMKKMDSLEQDFVAACFDHKNLQVVTNGDLLESKIKELDLSQSNLLLMTSGNFDKMDLDAVL